MPAPRHFAALVALALAATAGCDAMELLLPELMDKPSPRPSSPRYSQPLASPEAFAFQPRQWVPQGRLVEDRLDLTHTWLVAPPAAGTPVGFLATTQGGWLYRTLDGGVTWSRVAIAATADRQHAGLSFIDANMGWLATAAQIYGTTDAGTTWTLLRDFEPTAVPGAPEASPDPTRGRPITSLAFTGQATGFLLKGGRLYRTRDGGRTWADEEVAGQTEPPTRLAVMGDQVWTGGRGVSHFLPGQGWAAPTGKFRFDAQQSALTFVSPTEGWALAQPEEGAFGAVPLFHTLDGGDTWTPHPLKDVAGEKLPGTGEAARMAWAGDRTGWIAAGANLYVTADGGASWVLDKTTTLAGIGPIQALAPLGPNAGWVVGNGAIHRLAELR